MPQTKSVTPVLCEPAQSKCTWTKHKNHFMQKFTGKMPQTKSVTPVLCEPAQSKCTWTFHKSHFVREYTGKMPQTSWSTLIKHQPFTLTVRTPQFGHTVWGMKKGDVPLRKALTKSRGYISLKLINPFPLLLNVPQIFKTRVHLQF